MNEDPNSEQEEDSKPTGPDRKPFNPMMTYIYFAVAILSGYFVLYIAGYLGLTVFGLIFMVVRKASYVNVAHALFYFILLVVNGYSLSQGGGLLLLPQWELLTDWSPVFILLSTYGITNIKAMYVPDK
jgi:hypothetical protein